MEFSTLAKGINRGLGANKLHKPSIEYFFKRLEENMYNNNNNTKKAVDFYKEWHTEDGLKI